MIFFNEAKLVFSLFLCALPIQISDGKVSAPVRTSRFDNKTAEFSTSKRQAKQLSLPSGARLNMNTVLNIPLILAKAGPPPMQLNLGIPMVLNFDQLGLTSSDNPLNGLISQINSLLGTLNLTGLLGKRKRRDAIEDACSHPGGDRRSMYQALEKTMGNFGMDGRGCMLRAICETQLDRSFGNFGFLGEIFERFMSASQETDADLLIPEYLEAEEIGKQKKNCDIFFPLCPKSIYAEQVQITE